MPSISHAFVKYQGRLTLVLSSLFILAGVSLLGYFALSQESAPTPIAAASSVMEIFEKGGKSSKPNSKSIKSLGYSKPVSISIPAINVKSELISLGQNADGSVAVPGEANYNKAAWYKNSPTPGQRGASIIEGHLDYVGKGPAIFYRLADLKPGDTVQVKRQDGKTVSFKIEMVASYTKENFPTAKVYAQPDKQALRLITCGGNFNGQSGEYDSNTIAFAYLENSPG